jgi:hypothetical protein
MNSPVYKAYLAWGVGVCLFFGTSAIAGWKFPWPKPSSGSSFRATPYGGAGAGRSTGGSWGGGK